MKSESHISQNCLQTLREVKSARHAAGKHSLPKSDIRRTGRRTDDNIFRYFCIRSGEDWLKTKQLMETIKRQDFRNTDSGQYYEETTFEGCELSGMSLDGMAFEDCIFTECNLSLSIMSCRLSDCTFRKCKMNGTDFSHLGKLSSGLAFENCDLSFAIFERCNLKKSRFSGCNIREAAFFDANLTESIFKDCDLYRAGFQGANLTKADLSQARNWSIVPESCFLNKTIFSEDNLRGLVGHLNIVIK